MENILQQIFLFVISCNFIENANILAVTPTPFHTHQAAFRPLWKTLAKNGHNLTLITTNPMTPNGNITQIDISECYSILAKHKSRKNIIEETFFESVLSHYAAADEMMKFQLTHPKIQQLKDPSHYHCDVILTELYFPSYIALGKKLNCPVIGITSMDAYPTIHEFVGNAIHPALFSYTDFGFGDDMSFFERLMNTLITVLPRPFFPIIEGMYDSVTEEYVGKNLPRSEQLFRNLSLLIVNANPIFYPIRPSTSITINVGGGLHFEEPLPLPKVLINLRIFWIITLYQIFSLLYYIMEWYLLFESKYGAECINEIGMDYVIKSVYIKAKE